MIRKRLMGAVLCAVVGWSALSAQANPLNLTMGLPDILTQALSVTYVYTPPVGPGDGTGVLSVSGSAVQIALADPPPVVTTINAVGSMGPGADFTSGDYTLDITLMVDTATGLPTSAAGTLLIEGEIPGLLPPVDGPTLLAGTLMDFGFSAPPPAGGVFEFVFDALSGEVSHLYTGGKAGVILTPGGTGTQFTGDFRDDFSNNTASGNANNFNIAQVPEPTTALLTLIAVSAVASRRRLLR